MNNINFKTCLDDSQKQFYSFKKDNVETKKHSVAPDHQLINENQLLKDSLEKLKQKQITYETQIEELKSKS